MVALAIALIFAYIFLPLVDGLLYELFYALFNMLNIVPAYVSGFVTIFGGNTTAQVNPFLAYYILMSLFIRKYAKQIIAS